MIAARPQTAKQLVAKCPQVHCLLIVRNEVLGTHSELILPETSDEVMENSMDALLAVRHGENVNCLESYGTLDGNSYEEDPLAVSIHKSAERIVIKWWPTGDLEAARRRFAEIQQRRALA